jgi:hypothetical protein
MQVGSEKNAKSFKVFFATGEYAVELGGIFVERLRSRKHFGMAGKSDGIMRETREELKTVLELIGLRELKCPKA